MTKAKLLLILCAFFVLDGCSGGMRPPATFAVTLDTTPVVIFPTFTNVPNATATPPSLTNTPSPTTTEPVSPTPKITSTLIVVPGVSQTQQSLTKPLDCIELKPTTTLSFSEPSILVLFSDSPASFLEESIFWDSITHTISSVGNTKVSPWNFIISLNGHYLVVEDCPESGCYNMLRTATKVIKKFPWDKDEVFWIWLDNERVEILQRIEPHDLLILNPFSGEETRYHFDLPAPFFTDRIGDETILPMTIDPSLKRIFYYTASPQKLVLWDIQSQKTIASLPDQTLSPSTVLTHNLSPDGKRILATSPFDGLSNPNELFQMNVSGEIQQVTHYQDQYGFSSVSVPTWSPDNQHIAFWHRFGVANIDPKKLDDRLVILNPETQEERAFCQIDRFQYDPNWINWGPSGDQIIVNVSDSERNITPVLIDLVHQTYAPLPELKGYATIGWMIP